MQIKAIGVKSPNLGFQRSSRLRPKSRTGPIRVRSQAIANGTELALALKPLDGSYETVHKFSSFSNWILPGHLMIGRYPYVEPGELKKCRTHEIGERQLRQILETGIRTFVSVQSDVISQNEMPLGGDKGFLPYKPTAELIASALEGPPTKESFEGIRNRFIDRFLPRKSVKTKSETTQVSADCIFVHHPVKGMKTLTPQDLDPVLTDLETRLTGGEKLYIHCWGGRGRAGIVGSCLLAKLFELSADECAQRIGRAFLTRNDDCKFCITCTVYIVLYPLCVSCSVPNTIV
eukprot:g5607.t1